MGSCGVVFYHKERDISMAVHGDDFTLTGLEEDLFWMRDLMKSWFEIKVRAMLGHWLSVVIDWSLAYHSLDFNPH